MSRGVRVGENGFEWVGFFGEKAVSLVAFKKGKTGKRYPLFQDGNRLVEDRSFRSTKDNHKDHWGGENIKITVAHTGAGQDVLLWGDSGFERVGGKFRKTFSLAPGPMWPGKRATVPAGPDGFYYVANSCLFEAQPSAEPIPRLAQLTNVMAVRSGPEGSLLVTEGDNKSGDWGKLYWPGSGELIRLKPALLPDIGSRYLRTIYWLEDLRRLLFFTGETVWFIPWEEVKVLPRSKA